MVSKVLEIRGLCPLLCTAFLFAVLYGGDSDAGARTLHYSSYSDDKEVFSSAIAAYVMTEAKDCTGGEEGTTLPAPKAGIVSHHLLAKALITDFFECVSRKGIPERVILIGPDHFNKGSSFVSVSGLPWKTPFGLLFANEAAVKTIFDALGIGEDSSAFMGEHSIGAITPFIRHYFPKSTVVPIMVKNTAPVYILRRLSDVLGGFMRDEKTLLIVSMDFSHGKTQEEARLMDAASSEAILGQRINDVYKLDVDCRACLYSLIIALRPYRAEIRRRSDSAEVSGLKDLKDVTSYFTIFMYGGR